MSVLINFIVDNYLYIAYYILALPLLSTVKNEYLKKNRVNRPMRLHAGKENMLKICDSKSNY